MQICKLPSMEREREREREMCLSYHGVKQVKVG